jgi:hypothetical protein
MNQLKRLLLQTFDKIGIPRNRVEYDWGVYVDVDSSTETGGPHGAEYYLSFDYSVLEPDATITRPIGESGMWAVVWRNEGGSSWHWNIDFGYGDFWVDDQANTIVLEGVVPGIWDGSRLYFRTYGWGLGRDRPG